MASSTIKNNELKSSTDYGKLSTRYSTSMRWPCARWARSEEHTSELQSQSNLVCRLLLEKKKNHVNIVLHGRPIKVVDYEAIMVLAFNSLHVTDIGDRRHSSHTPRGTTYCSRAHCSFQLC